MLYSIDHNCAGKKNFKTKDVSSPSVNGYSETLFYVCDFFKHRLTNFEKLIFYGYFITGLTYKEIGEICDCSHQYVEKTFIRPIVKKLKNYWNNKKHWQKRFYDS